MQRMLDTARERRVCTSSHSSLVTRARKPIRVQRSFFFARNRLKSLFKSIDRLPSRVWSAHGRRPYFADRSSSTESWANHLKRSVREGKTSRCLNLQSEIQRLFRKVMFTELRTPEVDQGHRQQVLDRTKRHASEPKGECRFSFYFISMSKMSVAS